MCAARSGFLYSLTFCPFHPCDLCCDCCLDCHIEKETRSKEFSTESWRRCPHKNAREMVWKILNDEDHNHVNAQAPALLVTKQSINNRGSCKRQTRPGWRFCDVRLHNVDTAASKGLLLPRHCFRYRTRLALSPTAYSRTAKRASRNRALASGFTDIASARCPLLSCDRNITCGKEDNKTRGEKRGCRVRPSAALVKRSTREI